MTGSRMTDLSSTPPGTTVQIPATLPEDFISIAAEYALGFIPAERAAAALGVSVIDFLDRLEVPEVLRDVEQAAAKAAQSGGAIRSRAREALAVAVNRVGEVVNDPETAPSTLLNAAKLLGEVADLPARAGGSAQSGDGFSVVINFPQGGRKAIDVTPSSAGIIDVEASE